MLNRRHWRLATSHALIIDIRWSVIIIEIYVAEMFADRVAACKTYEKDRYTTMSPWRYYKRTKEYITIHPETRKLLERLLKMLAVKGEDEVYRYLRYLIRVKKTY